MHDLIQFIGSVFEWVNTAQNAKTCAKAGTNGTQLLTNWCTKSIEFDDYMLGGDKARGNAALAGARPFVNETFSALKECFVDESVGEWFGIMAVDFGSALAEGVDATQNFLPCIHEYFVRILTDCKWDGVAHNCTTS